MIAHEPTPIRAPTLDPDALRQGLLATVDLLKQCRAADVTEGYIDGYVALQWLEWNGGTLRLTAVGQNICSQLSVGLA
jgi:hypothetical protein